MAAAQGSWREADVARALRSTYRTGLGKLSRSSHHRVYVAEQVDVPESPVDDEEDDPECDALLADHGVPSEPPIDECDIIDALIGWKEQRKLHSRVKLGRGFVKPDLEAYRPRVRCHNCHKVGHYRKDCKEPPRSTASAAQDAAKPKPKGHFFVNADGMYSVPAPPTPTLPDMDFEQILQATIRRKHFQ